MPRLPRHENKAAAEPPPSDTHCGMHAKVSLFGFSNVRVHERPKGIYLSRLRVPIMFVRPSPGTGTPDLVDKRLKSFSPEQREHFRESMYHNRQVLRKLSKM